MNKRLAKVRLSQRQPVARQRGAALVLIVVAMLVLLLMAGMALDVGHMMLNKTRLQNAVDTAALSAAKTLDQTDSTTLATAAALQGLGLDANAPGNKELGNTYDGNNLQVTVQYSSALSPFTPGSTTGPYVRVIATGFTFPTALIEVAGLTKLGVSATAVAGPSPTLTQACNNVVPILACGDPSKSNFGYTPLAPVVLKSSAGTTSALGPGNFQLLQLTAPGDNAVRNELAGTYSSCVTVNTATQTETGNGTGPVAQGLNTRLGIYQGGMTETPTTMPDVITDHTDPQYVTVVSTSTTSTTGTTTVTNTIQYQGPNSNNTPVSVDAGNIDTYLYDYSQYTNDLIAQEYDNPPPTGVWNRRVLTVPFGQCNGTTNGTGTVDVQGFGCFFMLLPVVQKGTSDYIIGQFLATTSTNCDGPGDAGQTPDSGPGPYVIELYHNPGSPDS